MRVEQDHDVALVLDQALGFLDDHVGDLDVALGRFVEGRGDDLALDRALHVGDFFGALVDEQDDQPDVRVVGGDGIGDLLHEDGLAGAGRGHDQAALPFADGDQQVHDAGGDVAVRGLHLDALPRVDRRQVVEEDLVRLDLRRFEVDVLDLQQGKVALAFLGRADLAGDRVAGAQVEAPDLRGRDVDVVRTGQVVVIRRAQESECRSNR